MNKNIKVYMASGWFNERDNQILTELEDYLRSKESINPYFPRHDGIKLEPGQFHDPAMRERVFKDNIHNIDTADLVIANIDGNVCQDTGTVYEVGYAMAKGIPVIGYQKDKDGKMRDQLKSVVPLCFTTCTGIEELDYVIETLELPKKYLPDYTRDGVYDKVLLVAPDNTEENRKNGSEVASILVECFRNNFKWVDNLSNPSIATNIDTIFKDVGFMVAVIDDRHPIVSWMMGQCYARNIPIISYTNYNWDVNLMLALSVVQHIKGFDVLRSISQKIKRDGINSLDKYDNSNLRIY